MRAIIFANGQYKAGYLPQPQDHVITADGGAHHCLRHGIQPAVVIGDLDSLGSEELLALKAGGAEVISYPRRKDYNDLELAIEYALNIHPSEILILGGVGGRWDQTIANILLAAAQTTITVHMLDGAQEMHFLHSGEKVEIHGDRGDIISLIPLCGDSRGITTQGLEYPLNNEPLLFGSTRGISNVLRGHHATISLADGLLLCTVDHLQERGGSNERN